MLTPIVVSSFFLFWVANALILFLLFLPTNAVYCILLGKTKDILLDF